MSLWHRYLDKPRLSPETEGTWERPSRAKKRSTTRYADGMNGSYLGPSFSVDEIGTFIQTNGYAARRIDRATLGDEVAALLADEKVVGLFQGRMEFGPRALGGRSILGDARSPKMQSVMNLKIKFRESFRPFAPSVLREHVADWFDMDADSPYMLLVADVLAKHRLEAASGTESLWGIDKLNVPRSSVPAITHVDYSARIQTVRRETNPLYYDIISAFHRRTGCPVIVNTSFNVGASRSSARRRTRIAASCVPTWTCSCSRISCWTNPHRRRCRIPGSGAKSSRLTDAVTPQPHN